MTNQWLNSPEVLRLFFDELFEKKDILSAALTCRSFLEPALDKMWHKIETFAPILGCLPEDLLEYREEFHEVAGELREVKVAYMRRELRSGDLYRYLTHYAHRIRAVRAPPFQRLQKRASLDLLKALQAATDFQRGALSPHITEYVGYPDCITGFFQHLSLFLGPRTLRLLLPVNPSRFAEVTFLRYILKHLPFLKELEIWRHASNKDFDRIFDPCIYLADTSLNRLESLTIKELSDNAIPHLASLPCLTTLNLSLAPGAPFISSLQVGQNSGFGSLRFLYLTASWENVVSLLQHLPCESPIESLLATYSSDDADLLHYVYRFQKIIDVVASRANPKTLRTFHAIEGHSHWERPVQEPLDLGSAAIAIGPLFVFKELRALSLSCSCDVIWPTPKEVKMIPIVWQNIEDLNFKSSYAYRFPRIDHTHLLELTYNCRHLQTLEISFDATKITGEERHLAQPGSEAPRLQLLFVDQSPIESPSLVTSFFAFHYPTLRIIEASGQFSDIYGQRWETVWRAIWER